jgi:hypothetical protein
VYKDFPPEYWRVNKVIPKDGFFALEGENGFRMPLKKRGRKFHKA